jgi:3-oxoacyl-[acyl-carrier protein] reductase
MIEQKLNGRIALVTGASKGIGAEIALHLAAAGAEIVVNYASDAAGAQRVATAINGAGGRAVIMQADIGDATDRTRLLERIASEFGRLDILVNNAGVFQIPPLEEITQASIDWMFRTNVFGLLLLIQGAVGLMHKGGSIINISSLASTTAPLHYTIYSATKAAVDSITRSLARELGPRNIRVNAIRPGAIETEGVVAAGLLQGDRLKNFIESAPLGRVGLPVDVAPAAVFLASDDTAWMTGETLLISGGRF